MLAPFMEMNKRLLAVELNPNSVQLIIVQIIPPKQQTVRPFFVIAEQIFVVDQAGSDKRHPVVCPHRRAKMVGVLAVKGSVWHQLYLDPSKCDETIAHL